MVVLDHRATVGAEAPRAQRSIEWQKERYGNMRKEMARETEEQGMAWSWGSRGWQREGVARENAVAGRAAQGSRDGVSLAEVAHCAEAQGHANPPPSEEGAAEDVAGDSPQLR